MGEATHFSHSSEDGYTVTKTDLSASVFQTKIKGDEIMPDCQLDLLQFASKTEIHTLKYKGVPVPTYLDHGDQLNIVVLKVGPVTANAGFGNETGAGVKQDGTVSAHVVGYGFEVGPHNVALSAGEGGVNIDMDAVQKSPAAKIILATLLPGGSWWLI